MKTSRLKNIIILTLLLFNAFLAVLLLSQKLQQQDAYAHSVEQLHTLYENSGISLDVDELPTESALPAVSLSRDSTSEAAFVRELMGEAVVSESGGVSRYANASGVCSFRANGACAAEFSDLTVSDPSAFCEKLCKNYGYCVTKDVKDAAGAQTVTGVYMLENSPAAQVTLSFTFEGERLLSLEGILLSSASAEREAYEMDAVTALVRFLDSYRSGGAVCTAVTDIHAEYLLQGSAVSQGKLFPAWYIETDVSGFYVNMESGEVTRSTN